MTVSRISSGSIDRMLTALYGASADLDYQRGRFIHVAQEHERQFGVDDVFLVTTSGRSELGGNHTDHNLGKVIAATINLDTIGAVHQTDDNIVTLASEGFETVRVDLSDLEMREDERNTTDALIRGIAKAFSERGARIGGWCANTTTNVLKGSGLSSSAAIEVLCGTLFNHLYNQDRFSTTDLAIMGQYAENVYYGKPSGLMDQVACANGGIVSIDFEDKADPKITPVSIDFAQYGYSLVIVDTKGDHADLTADYASIPAEMKSVAEVFGGNVLREVDEKEFFSKIAEVRKTLNNDRAVLRAIHYFEENRRVDEMVECLTAHDIEGFFRIVNRSGQSSSEYLQNVFSCHDYEHQGLSLAIALSREILNDRGAVRVHGGGFAGTIQAYVPHDLLDSYVSAMESVFGEHCASVLNIRPLPTVCFS